MSAADAIRSIPTPRELRVAPREPRAGDCVDRYELLHPIARGGMGHVWAARLRGTGGFERIVAIKTALPELACDSRVRAMFLDEARVASAIVHRNVAPVVDFLEWEGAQYLVMEWVEGASLKALHDAQEARGQRIPLGVLLRVLADVCAGLHAAHELCDTTGALCGIVHRDVSPQNVLVSVEGVAKLIDFGVAKARSRATQETTFGALKGKLAFMAPEQARGGEIDRRADVWSVGATMFYMLTGHGPFDAEDRSETLRMLVSSLRPLPPPADLPECVQRVLSVCLARKPEERYATAEQLGWAIEDAIEETGIAASARDVAEFTAECAGAEIAAQRAHVQVGVREPMASSITRSGVVVSAHQAARGRWLTLGGAGALSAVAAAMAFVALRHGQPPALEPPPPPVVAVEQRPVAPAPIPVDPSTIIELTPVDAVALHPAASHVHPPAARPPRAIAKPRAARPSPHTPPPRTSDDFGSAVETRK